MITARFRFSLEEFAVLAHSAHTRALASGKVSSMVIAQIGPLTAAVEALATAVGAGIVLIDLFVRYGV